MANAVIFWPFCDAEMTTSPWDWKTVQMKISFRERRFSLANLCSAESRVIVTRACGTHARKLGSCRACSAREAQLRRVRNTYLSLSSAITSGWSKPTRLGISEIIISQSLAGVANIPARCQMSAPVGLRDLNWFLSQSHTACTREFSTKRIWL